MARFVCQKLGRLPRVGSPPAPTTSHVGEFVKNSYAIRASTIRPTHTIGTGAFRERSVLQLGRACHFDERHARNVAGLSLQLFDGELATGVHRLGDWERERLAYSALPHDVGTYLSYNHHRRHSYSMIRNAELLGFDQTEVAVMAPVVRYHHKKFPRSDSPQLAELSKQQRKVVWQLCVLLRIAESLDRSHVRVVQQAQFEADGDGDVVRGITAERDCQLELWELKYHRKAYRRAFKRRIGFEVKSSETVAALHSNTRSRE